MVEFVEHREGRTRLLVPSASLTRDPPPTAPVFFNPAASLNRDVTVAITAATGGSTFCDSMSGVGARGLRVAKEAGRAVRVTMVDFNAAALRAARKGATLNNVARKCEFSDSETTSFLASRYRGDEKFDYVDVDPFGTPVRQLQAALSATSRGGILSVTATDTAVLCGVYPRVAARRYGALSAANQAPHETGIRILAGALARAGAQIDIGVEPLFAHATRHYIRAFAKVAEGASRADESLKGLGYVSWCPRCGHAEATEHVEPACAACGKKPKVTGPLWVHGMASPGLVKGAADAAKRMNLASASKLIESASGLDEYPPWSFSIDKASSSLRSATAPEAQVHRFLADEGWKVMRTPFEKTGVKTDAPYAAFVLAVERAASHEKD